MVSTIIVLTKAIHGPVLWYFFLITPLTQNRKHYIRYQLETSLLLIQHINKCMHLYLYSLNMKLHNFTQFNGYYTLFIIHMQRNILRYQQFLSIIYTKPALQMEGGFAGGTYRTRTNDFYDVNVALYQLS